MPEKKQKWWQKTGGELIALAVLIPFIIVLSFVLIRFTKPPAAAPSTTPQAAASASPLQTPASPDSSPIPASPIAGTVGLEIVDRKHSDKYQVALAEKAAVIDVMNQAKSQGLQLTTKDYGGSLGIFVEAINSIANDPATGRYWNLYINGKRSSLGASNAAVAPGDAIRWSLEKENGEN